MVHLAADVGNRTGPSPNSFSGFWKDIFISIISSRLDRYDSDVCVSPVILDGYCAEQLNFEPSAAQGKWPRLTVVALAE